MSTDNVIPFPHGGGDDDCPADWDACYDGPPIEISEHATVYTLTETAFLLDMPIAETEMHLSDGTVPGVNVGGHWLIWRPALTAWLNSLGGDQ